MNRFKVEWRGSGTSYEEIVETEEALETVRYWAEGELLNQNLRRFDDGKEFVSMKPTSMEAVVVSQEL